MNKLRSKFQQSRRPGRLTIGTLVINRSSRAARIGDDQLRLSSAEFDLLWCLASHAGEVVTREELFARLLCIEYDGLNRTIDLRLSRLRRKLGDDNKEPRIIKTVRSEGYLLATDWE